VVRSLRAARSLAPADWRLLASAWARLGGIAVALRCGVPLPTLRRLLRPGYRAGPGRREVSAPRLAGLVRAAARLVPLRTACLARALCLENMLAERGLEPVLRLGVRRAGAGIAAHAWIEIDDAPVGQPSGIARCYLPLRATGSVR
jgi:hypothetical protein